MNRKGEKWEIKYYLMILKILMAESRILLCFKIKLKKKRKRKISIIIFLL